MTPAHGPSDKHGAPHASAPAAPAARPPVIALLTDFGTEGWYVAVMKGVIKGICPQADIVDISHNVSPQGIIEGALMLGASAPWFPPETIFVAVVDPGVGTRREAILLRAADRWFLGPNNGLLGYVAQRHPDHRCRLLSNPRYHLPDPGSTFHGRDIFAPAAAHLAAGADPDDVAPGPANCFGLVASTAWYDRGTIGGDVIYFDHFGNAVTNIPRELFASHFAGMEDTVHVHVGDRVFTGICRTFGDVKPGEPVAYFGSMGNLEIGVSHCNARDLLGLHLLDKVMVRKPAAGR